MNERKSILLLILLTLFLCTGCGRITDEDYVSSLSGSTFASGSDVITFDKNTQSYTRKIDTYDLEVTGSYLVLTDKNPRLISLQRGITYDEFYAYWENGEVKYLTGPYFYDAHTTTFNRK